MRVLCRSPRTAARRDRPGSARFRHGGGGSTRRRGGGGGGGRDNDSWDDPVRPCVERCKRRGGYRPHPSKVTNVKVAPPGLFQIGRPRYAESGGPYVEISAVPDS